MSPTENQIQAALDAALQRIYATAGAVADRASDLLGTLALSATRTADRDALLSAQFELRRNMAAFHVGFREALRESVKKDIAPRPDGRRSLEATDWQSLSLVGDDEVEQRMQGDRIGALILQECENEQRDVAMHVGGLLQSRKPDEERNPLRPKVLGAALYRAVEAVSREPDVRKLLVRELGLAFARAMKTCYAEVLKDLQARGVRPASLQMRTGDGPGFHLGGINSGYTGLSQRDDYRHSGSGPGALDGPSSGGGFDAGVGAAAVAPPRRGPGLAGLPAGASAPAARGSHWGGAPGTGVGGLEGRFPSVAAEADAHLMNLLRRLTALASRPGALDPPMRAVAGAVPSTRGGGFDARAARPAFSASGGGLASAGAAAALAGQAENLSGLMAVNLIRAHREELLQASSGKLDHMVIDVVGSLFDQILSDPRVPPQMARQIARLQLPVLRVAMADSGFFSSRRHPVRRFVNRIASLACAFDEFEDGPGRQFLARVRELVQEIVEGDFDQIDLYTRKLGELEHFITDQTQHEVAQSPAAATLEGKESELRIQQRYMLQLAAALKPAQVPPYLAEFVSQVWSQALVLAVRRDGPASERYARFKRVGRDVLMSVQPKGSPVLRKKFLMQLPQLMKDLNEGMALIGWPEAAQKVFFGQLMPAHAESMKLSPLSELDHNLLAKQFEAVFNTPIPGAESLSVADVAAEVEPAIIEKRFTPEEAQQVGLVQESAVDWSGTVDIEIGGDEGPDTEPNPDAVASDLSTLGLDVNLDLAPSDPPEPSRGPQLMDHIKLGFAYQMLLKDEWQKVRLTYVSPGRTFFVFSRGRKHQETISMTSRMLARMCEAGRMRAFESSYLIERATLRARKQLAALKAAPTQH